MIPLRRKAQVSFVLFALATVTACSAGGAAVQAEAGDRTAVQPEAGDRAAVQPAAKPAAVKERRAVLGIRDITPMGSDVEKVGVGFPIIVTFDKPVTAKADAVAALEVTSERPVDGAWRWLTSSKVVYRTKTYWRPHQYVTLNARLSLIPGNEGAKDVTRRFAVGTANISVVDTKRHVMKVRRDGKLVKSIPISAGRGGLVKNGVDVFLTTSGVHLTMGKKAVESMSSAWMGVTDPSDKRYYKEEINWAVRISDSGEYVHQSLGDYHFLGRSNQSHGCVRATPAGAKWFFGIAQRGDVVKITGTKRKLDWRNGWSFWQLNWTQWKNGTS